MLFSYLISDDQHTVKKSVAPSNWRIMTEKIEEWEWKAAPGNKNAVKDEAYGPKRRTKRSNEYRTGFRR